MAVAQTHEGEAMAVLGRVVAGQRARGAVRRLKQARRGQAGPAQVKQLSGLALAPVLAPVHRRAAATARPQVAVCILQLQLATGTALRTARGRGRGRGITLAALPNCTPA